MPFSTHKQSQEGSLEEIIQAMIEYNENSLKLLRYDDTLAQNQSNADTFVYKELKAKLANGPEASSASDTLLPLPSSKPRPSLSIDETLTVEAESCKGKEKEAGGPNAEDTTARNRNESKKTNQGNKVAKVPLKAKSTQGDQSRIQLSLSDLWTAATKESPRASNTLENDQAKDLEKSSGSQDH